MKHDSVAIKPIMKKLLPVLATFFITACSQGDSYNQLAVMSGENAIPAKQLPVKKICLHSQSLAKIAMKRRQKGYSLEDDLKIINTHADKLKINGALSATGLKFNKIVNRIFADAHTYPQYKSQPQQQKIAFDYAKHVYSECLQGKFF